MSYCQCTWEQTLSLAIITTVFNLMGTTLIVLCSRIYNTPVSAFRCLDEETEEETFEEVDAEMSSFCVESEQEVKECEDRSKQDCISKASGKEEVDAEISSFWVESEEKLKESKEEVPTKVSDAMHELSKEQESVDRFAEQLFTMMSTVMSGLGSTQTAKKETLAKLAENIGKVVDGDDAEVARVLTDTLQRLRQ